MSGLRTTFTADIQPFRTALSQGKTEVRGFESTVKGVDSRLSTFGNRFSGRKLVQDAELMTRAIRDIGGASLLTDKNLRTVNATLAEAQQQYQRLGQTAPASVRALTTEVHRLVQEQDRLAAASRTAAQSAAPTASLRSSVASGLSQGLGIGAGLGLAGGIAVGVQQLGAAITDVAQRGQQLAELERPFIALSGGVTEARARMADMQSATKGLVTETALLQAANKASILGITALGVDMSELAGLATTLGRAMGQDAAKSVDDATTALGRMSPQIADNLGLSLRLGEANEALAAKLGKSVEALTEQEKKLAFANAFMTAAREKVATLGEVQLTLGDQVKRTAVLYDDLSARVGAYINTFGPLTGAVDTLVDSLEEVSTNSDDFVRLLGELEAKTPQAEGDIGGLEKKIRALADAVAEFSTDRVKEGMAFLIAPGAAVAAATFNFAIGTLNRRMEENRKIMRQGGLIGILDSATGGLPSALPVPGRTADIRLSGDGGSAGIARLEKEEAEARAQWLQAQAAREREAARAIEEKTRKLKAQREEIERLTGVTARNEALKLADQILEIGEAGDTIPVDKVEALAKQLMAARAAAFEAGEETGKLGKALNTLPIASARRIPGLESGMTYGSAIGAAAQSVAASALSWRGSNRAATGLISSTNPTAGMLIGLPGQVLPQTVQVTKATRDWAASLREVSRSFADLAQVTDGRLDGLTRGASLAFSGGATSQALLTSLGGEEFTKTKKGQAIGGALSGTLVGFQLGRGAGSRGGAVLQGAAGGAASGLAFGAVGAGVGLVAGAASAYFGQRSKESELRKLKDLQASELVAQYGSLDELLEQVGRLGLSQQTFLERFYGEPKEFAKAVAELTTALTREKAEAEKLAKALRSVKDARGTLSLTQIRDLAGVRPGSAAGEAVVEFEQEQRAQAEAGLARAVDALRTSSSLSDQEIETLTRGVSDAAERERLIEKALDEKAKTVLTRFGAGVNAAAAGLLVAFESALEAGEDAVDLLARLGPDIDTVLGIFDRGGQASAGIGQLKSYQTIATDPVAGPALQLANGLGTALAGFTNSGLMSPELFGQIANGIGQAYKQMELAGKGGLDAARLLQPQLQTLWQLVQDYPGFEEQLDDDTRALIDFAQQSGIVGDKFRPAVDRMIDKIQDLIDRFDIFLARLDRAGDFELPTPPGSPDGTNYQAPDGTTVQVPGAATGGLVSRPTVLMAGERGPEAIIPLDRLPEMMGAGGAMQQVITVQIGQQVIARAALRGMPREFRLVGI